MSSLLFTALIASGLHLEADRLVVEDGRLLAEGNVSIRSGDLVVEGERATMDEDLGYLTVESGAFQSPQASLSFQRATMADGEWTFHGARLVPCPCAGGGGPWSLEVREASVGEDRVVTFTGGLLRVGGVPLLPVPGGCLPMGARRSGLLLPRAGHTPDGWEAGLPLYLVLGPHADATVTPTWREERGGRVGLEGRYMVRGGEGQVDLEGGPDALADTWRGRLGWEHGQDSGGHRTAATLDLHSDGEWARDFSTSYLDRQLPFRESRLLAEAGGLRFQHEGVSTSGAPLTQRLAGASWRRLATDTARVSPWAGAGVSILGLGREPYSASPDWYAGELGAGLAVGGNLGLLEGEADLGGRGLLLEPVAGGDPSGFFLGTARGSLTLPMWADAGGRRWVLHPSVEAAARADLASGPVPDEPGLLPDPPAWELGPAFQVMAVGGSGVPIHGMAAAPWTPAGLAPRLQAWGRWGRLWADVAGSALLAGGALQPEVASAGVGLDGAPVSGWGRVIQSSLLPPQAMGGLSVDLHLGAHRLTPAVSTRWSIDPGAFLEGRLGLAWRPPCGCLGLEVGAAWAEDRSLPDMALGLLWEVGR